MFHLPQCIDTDHFSRSAKSEVRSGRTTFLCVGALIERKGIDLLLDSWIALPRAVREDATLIIAGTGPLEQALKKKSRLYSICRYPVFRIYPLRRLAPAIPHRPCAGISHPGGYLGVCDQ